MTGTLVTEWTGRETRALRVALRMTVTDFAKSLQVSTNMVGRWERGGEETRIRMGNQRVLDTMLQIALPDVQARFNALVDRGLAGMSADEAQPTSLDEQRRHPRDGRLMLHVPAGRFLAGDDGRSLHVADFWIDTFPVTNRDYAVFVAAAGAKPPYHWEGGRCPEALADHPVVYVDWHAAAAYAQWCGKALPTARQWEKAARGQSGSVYPWGNGTSPAKCNVRESGIKATTPVGRYRSGVSPYGVFDMCGNAWEWLSSASEIGRYELRGGAWTSPFDRCAPARVNDAAATMSDDDTGFRCVASTLDDSRASAQ
ncbi:SUMF1/EgtB/PvdO family nonheme iron enzyme [Streptacidiphilus sp. EB103A]|uniref:SUMF1/EgtB/PvdO family nonheme iron enzyme n=1 Tax=Streptacidiphilus sp. EB103A TaxID=3156275 RepID=UPI003512EC7D